MAAATFTPYYVNKVKSETFLPLNLVGRNQEAGILNDGWLVGWSVGL